MLAEVKITNVAIISRMPQILKVMYQYLVVVRSDVNAVFKLDWVQLIGQF